MMVTGFDSYTPGTDLKAVFTMNDGSVYEALGTIDNIYIAGATYDVIRFTDSALAAQADNIVGWAVYTLNNKNIRIEAVWLAWEYV